MDEGMVYSMVPDDASVDISSMGEPTPKKTKPGIGYLVHAMVTHGTFNGKRYGMYHG